MSDAAPLEAILTRFLDSRESLTDEEFGRLLEALRTQPHLAERLKDHLLMDELLAQKFVQDRSDFIGKFERRLRAETQSRSPGMMSEETYSVRRPEQALANGTATRTAGNGHSRKSPAREASPARKTPAAPPPGSPGHPWLTLFAALGGLLLLAGGLLWLEYTDAARKIAEVDEAEGMALIYRDGVGTVAAAGMPILPGDEIRVPAKGELKLTFRDRSQVRLAENSKATFQPGTGRLPGILTSDRAKRIFVHQGRLEARIARQRPGKPLVLETPLLEAQVLGTRLIVMVDGTQSRLEVVEGSVSIQPKHEEAPPVELTAGHQVLATGDEVRIAPGDWPTNREGLVFLLSPRSAMSRTPNEGVRLFAEGPDHREAILRPRRDAVFENGRMVFRSGAFLAEDQTASALTAACQETNSLSLEMTFQTAGIPQTGPARWVTLSAGADACNFCLGQEGDQCVFRLLTAPETQPLQEIPLFVIPDNQPHHVAVTYGEDRLRCYLDGEEVPLPAEVQGSLAGWTARHLLFGDEWDGGGEWTGALSGVAIYNRVLSSMEIARNALHFQLQFRPDENSTETQQP